MGVISLYGVKESNLRFADDTMLLAQSEEKLKLSASIN